MKLKRSLLRKAGSSRGFTALEVMISMTLLAIGAAGVISMERGAIKANIDARRLDIANGIARLWVERLRRDATRWAYPNANSPNTPPDYSDSLLFPTGTAAGARPALLGAGNWYRPAKIGTAVPYISPGFDLTGQDVGDMADAFFCTNIRLTWLTSNVAGAGALAAPSGELIRAEIRVFWPRGLQTAPEANFCTGDPDEAAMTEDRYRFVYVTTAVRRNTATW